MEEQNENPIGESRKQKKCPKCGAQLPPTAKYCGACGFLFHPPVPEPISTPIPTRTPASQDQNSGVSGGIMAWIKSHLKIVIGGAVALAVVIILACVIPYYFTVKDNGTYCLINSDGEINQRIYFTLESGEWQGNDGLPGAGIYKKDGDKITLYWGEELPVYSGTVKDGVLRITSTTTGNTSLVCVSKKHKHNFVKGVCTKCGVENNELAYELSSDKKSYSVSGIGTCKDKDVMIPSSYNGKPVTSIGDSAFENCTSLTSVTIPDSVTLIGNDAFCGCSGLTKVTIPNSVTLIGNDAFCDCSALRSVAIPGNVTAIGNYAFSSCSALTKVTIPNSVTSIGNYAFSSCSALTKVTIPNSVTSIGNYAFYKCRGLTSITIPDSVTSIGNYAFSDCDKLQYNKYSNGLYIGNETNPYVLLVKAISKYITKYAIHSNTKCIDSSAFEDCSGTSIELPNSVTSIGDKAFYKCDSLTEVYYTGDIGSWCNISFGDRYSNPLYYAHKLYINDELVRELKMPDSVTEIKDYAFYNCSSLTRVVIPDSVTSIGDYAFGECSKLQYNEYSNGLYLGNETNPYLLLVKAKSEDITECTIHSKTKFIYSSAFSGCSQLTSITIPKGVTSIGAYVFYKCSSLTKIYFNGTKAQWEVIKKGDHWDYMGRFGSYTIVFGEADDILRIFGLLAIAVGILVAFAIFCKISANRMRRRKW